MEAGPPIERPQLWVLAGGNGAGKTTFYQNFLQQRGLLFVNADVIAGVLSPGSAEQSSYEAAHKAELLRAQLVHEGVSFCFATVFSHSSKIDFVAKAKACGYQVVLVYIHLADPQVHLGRVATRVFRGGHTVPHDKILSRLPRTLVNVQKAVPLADEVMLFDNTSAEQPFVLTAHRQGALLRQKQIPLPDWAREILFA